ncbi:S4 domain-containing protein [Nonomuraea jiangxiensis]|uniref:S4 domain-containing protein n=1 Tax=Nonomuraea jiangxiensis TaxID=633440 RepID=UPI003183D894
MLAARRSQYSVGVAGELRVDSWIWSVRLTKTRSIASDARRGGHVRVNGMRVKPAHAVRATRSGCSARDANASWTSPAPSPSASEPPVLAAECYASTSALRPLLTRRP